MAIKFNKFKFFFFSLTKWNFKNFTPKFFDTVSIKLKKKNNENFDAQKILFITIYLKDLNSNRKMKFKMFYLKKKKKE